MFGWYCIQSKEETVYIFAWAITLKIAVDWKGSRIFLPLQESTWSVFKWELMHEWINYMIHLWRNEWEYVKLLYYVLWLSFCGYWFSVIPYTKTLIMENDLNWYFFQLVQSVTWKQMKELFKAEWEGGSCCEHTCAGTSFKLFLQSATKLLDIKNNKKIEWNNLQVSNNIKLQIKCKEYYKLSCISPSLPQHTDQVPAWRHSSTWLTVCLL